MACRPSDWHTAPVMPAGSPLAIYHLSVKAIGRAKGRSATGAAAYRAAVRILDDRTGLVHDYERRTGVAYTEIVVPERSPAWAGDRDRLWNEAELAERRRNSTVAREFEVALPTELDPRQRQALARDLASEIVRRHRCAVDIAIHEPNREGDERNHHAHLLLTTRRLTQTGFAEKTRELDDLKVGEVVYWRERWAGIVNEHLTRYGHDARIDHRNLEGQGDAREPSKHLGPMLTAIERRGIRTEVGWRVQEEAAERLKLAAELGRIERERHAIERSILDLSGDVSAAKRDRDTGLTAHPDLETQRREGREAWLTWRDAGSDQDEHDPGHKADLLKSQIPDDEFAL